MSTPSTSRLHALREQRFDVRALSETTRLLSSSLDAAFILRSTLYTALSNTLSRKGWVARFDTVQQAYRPFFSRGLAFDADTCLQADELSEQLASVSQGHAYVLEIQFSGRPLALIGVGHPVDATGYSTEATAFLSTLGQLISPALHNAIVVEELQQANHDLDASLQAMQTLVEVGQALTRLVDQASIARQVGFTLMGQLARGAYAVVYRADPNGSWKVIATQGMTSFVGQEVSLDDAEIGLALLAAPPWFPEAEYVLPIRQAGSVRLLFAIGPTTRQVPMEASQIDFLSGLGHLTLGALERVRLFRDHLERERLEQELGLARTIQERLQLLTPPAPDRLDIAWLSRASRHVAGDYVDAFSLPAGRVAVAIGDVSGKGVAAAMLMSNLQAALHALVPMPLGLSDTMAQLNRVIWKNTPADRFISFFLAVLDPIRGLMQYVNAGHNPPLHLRGNQVSTLDQGGTLLGIFEHTTYVVGNGPLMADDVLFLYTDGLTEATGANGEEFGTARLRTMVTASASEGTAQHVIDAVDGAVDAFALHPELEDDRTALAVRVRHVG